MGIPLQISLYPHLTHLSTHLQHLLRVLLRDGIDLGALAQPTPQPVADPDEAAVALQRIAVHVQAADDAPRAHRVPCTGVRVEGVRCQGRYKIV